MKENLFKSVNTIMQHLQKKFRPFLELFLGPTFRNTKNENRNCAVAAEDLLLNMEKQLGPNIFKAILEKEDSTYLDKFINLKQNY